MYQGIETKFAGPTDSTGSRIIASCQARRMTVPYDHALGAKENHIAAAFALASAMGWLGAYVGGANASGRGYMFVSMRDEEQVLPKAAFHVSQRDADKVHEKKSRRTESLLKG